METNVDTTARKFNPLSLNFLVGVIFGISITSLLILNKNALQDTNELVRAMFPAARKNSITTGHF